MNSTIEPNHSPLRKYHLENPNIGMWVMVGKVSVRGTNVMLDKNSFEVWKFMKFEFKV
jgi:hypothetical protein